MYVAIDLGAEEAMVFHSVEDAEDWFAEQAADLEMSDAPQIAYLFDVETKTTQKYKFLPPVPSVVKC